MPKFRAFLLVGLLMESHHSICCNFIPVRQSLLMCLSVSAARFGDSPGQSSNADVHFFFCVDSRGLSSPCTLEDRAQRAVLAGLCLLGRIPGQNVSMLRIAAALLLF